MEKHYAQALWTMIEKGVEPKKAVHALHDLLVANGRVSLMPRIGHAFDRLARTEMAKSTLVLSVAYEKDAHAAKQSIKEILSEMNADAKDVEVRVDESLIGGWRLEGREQLHDASFKKMLLEMYNRATV